MVVRNDVKPHVIEAAATLHGVARERGMEPSLLRHLARIATEAEHQIRPYATFHALLQRDGLTYPELGQALALAADELAKNLPGTD